MQVGDEVIVEEKAGKKIKAYQATVTGIYPHFVNIRHPNGYLVSISKSEINKLKVITKEAENMRLTKEVLAEELKSLSVEEIAEKYNMKVHLVKALATRSGLIEGTGIYAKKHKKEKEEKKMSNLLRPTAFEGESGMWYQITSDTVHISDKMNSYKMIINKCDIENFVQEINKLNEYLQKQEKEE